MLNAEVSQMTGDNQSEHGRPHLKWLFDKRGPALDPLASSLHKANKRLIATVPNSEIPLTHSKHNALAISNRNTKPPLSPQNFLCIHAQRSPILPALRFTNHDPLLANHRLAHRNTPRIEFAVSHAKQTAGLGSNRNTFHAPHHAKLIYNSMPARGKFIVLEGIDGSGKRTQLEMLARVLEVRKIPHTRISFPRYDGFFGKLAARFLNGEFGPLDAVDAHFSALLYAGDRLEAKPKIEADLAAGRMVLADRYIGSNLAHQTALVAPAKRAEFLEWLKQLEYGIYALPVEDLVLYLRVPAAEAHRMVGQKGTRDYTKLHRDILEADVAHLEAASGVYDQLAQQSNWKKIECFDAAALALRAPEEIHREVLAAVEARIFPALHANR